MYRVLEARASVLAAAHARHPERFVRRVPRPLTPAAEVWINPPENRPTVRTLELPRDTQFVPQVSQSHRHVLLRQRRPRADRGVDAVNVPAYTIRGTQRSATSLVPELAPRST
jgi:hypothetical protein